MRFKRGGMALEAIRECLKGRGNKSGKERDSDGSKGKPGGKADGNAGEP